MSSPTRRGRVGVLALCCCASAECYVLVRTASASRIHVGMSHAPLLPQSFIGRSVTVLAASGDDNRPTLAGEKVALGVISAGSAYLLVSAGPGALFANPIFQKASRAAFRGGISGFVAGVIQVLTLMWLRTVMNYQYRNGGSARDTLRLLYKEGGIARLYRGVQFAIVQTPLTRFGVAAANAGVIEMLSPSALPLGITTALAAFAGSLWRVAITPLDTLKTTLQVNGATAYQLLMAKVRDEGPTVLYQGALANAVASFVASFPWWFTFNLASRALPAAPPGALALGLVRSAVAGILAAIVSDLVSNSLRVLKVRRTLRRPL
jgi:hypothetical protein